MSNHETTNLDLNDLISRAEKSISDKQTSSTNFNYELHHIHKEIIKKELSSYKEKLKKSYTVFFLLMFFFLSSIFLCFSLVYQNKYQTKINDLTKFYTDKIVELESKNTLRNSNNDSTTHISLPQQLKEMAQQTSHFEVEQATLKQIFMLDNLKINHELELLDKTLEIRKKERDLILLNQEIDKLQ